MVEFLPSVHEVLGLIPCIVTKKARRCCFIEDHRILSCEICPV